MKIQIPEEYPVKLTDDELFKQIEVYTKKATIAGRSESYVVGPSYWKEMVELGQIEISNRIQSKLLNQINDLTTEIRLLKEDNRKSGRINLSLSIVTIVLALITGYLGYDTLEYSKSSDFSDEAWKKTQTNLLKQNNVELLSIKNELIRNNSPELHDKRSN